MLQLAVWEGDEELSAEVAELSGGKALVRVARHPGPLSGPEFDLLVVSPHASGWAGAGELRCRAALVPGGHAALARCLPARLLVSYGMGRADTLTLSSLRDGRAAVCVQREFTSFTGLPVERQEVMLPYHGTPPELYLALAGTALLLYGPVAHGGKLW